MKNEVILVANWIIYNFQNDNSKLYKNVLKREINDTHVLFVHTWKKKKSYNMNLIWLKEKEKKDIYNWIPSTNIIPINICW